MQVRLLPTSLKTVKTKKTMEIEPFKRPFKIHIGPHSDWITDDQGKAITKPGQHTKLELEWLVDALNFKQMPAIKLKEEILNNCRSKLGAAYDPIYWQAALDAMEEYASQFQSLSSEAEKGEEIPESELPNHPAYQRGFQDGLGYNPSPPSPQEKQGVEETHRMQLAAISTASQGYFKDGDDIHPDYDSVALRDVTALYRKYDKLYKLVHEDMPPAPAAPDKGEEYCTCNVWQGWNISGNCYECNKPHNLKTQQQKDMEEQSMFEGLGNIMRPTPSVEKSEWEEAEDKFEAAAKLRRQFRDDNELATLYNHYDEYASWIEDKYISLLHSSGDRGRKEEE